MALPLLTLMIVNIIPVYPHDSFHIHPIYCTMLMIAAEAAFFLYLYVLYKNLKRISFLSRQSLRTELLSQEIDHYQSYLNTAAENRHDQRHHDSIVLAYLENNDTASAIQYLQHHEAVLAKSSLKQYCEEPTVNAVLRIYEKRCQEDRISFHADAVLPSVLNIDAADLGGMLGNLFENAVHAASKGKDGFLSLSCKNEDDSLLIELTNSSSDTADFHNGLPISHRPGGGTGTRSIKTTVQKYNGILSFSQSGNTFITRIIIPMHA